MKKYLFVLPEIILFGLASFWLLENLIASSYFNPFAFVVLIILLLQLVFKNKYVGFFMASLIALFSLYMVLAVFSEFRDFPVANFDAFQLLGFGLFLCSLGFGSAMLMFYKYLPKVF